MRLLRCSSLTSPVLSHCAGGTLLADAGTPLHAAGTSVGLTKLPPQPPLRTQTPLNPLNITRSETLVEIHLSEPLRPDLLDKGEQWKQRGGSTLQRGWFASKTTCREAAALPAWARVPRTRSNMPEPCSLWVG